MRDREILAWCAAVVVSAFAAVLAVNLTFFPRTETVTVTKTKTKTVTKVVKQSRLQGLKHLAFLDYQFDGVNGKGVLVTVSCKGYWDTATPPLVRKIGAEDGQVVYNICTAKG